MTVQAQRCAICGAARMEGLCQATSVDPRPLAAAREGLENGVPHDEIAKAIMEMGHSNTRAQSAISHAVEEQMRGPASSVSGPVILGILLIIGGIVASIVSYSSASPGETYTIWWGLVVVGAITLFTAGRKSE